MWDLPRPGIEPMSPALAGRFLTTVPPGKSLYLFLKQWMCSNFVTTFPINHYQNRGFFFYYFDIKKGGCSYSLEGLLVKDSLFLLDTMATIQGVATRYTMILRIFRATDMRISTNHSIATRKKTPLLLKHYAFYLELLCTVGRNVKWYSHCGKQYGGSSKN